MRLMKPSALKMDQRRDCGGCCCQEDGVAVAQVPGLKLQRQESLSWLSCPSLGHMSLSYRTGRAQGPRQLWGLFRQEI